MSRESRADEVSRDLLERSGAGEREAFDELFARLAARLSMFLRLRLGGRLGREVELVDVLQETYLSAWKSVSGGMGAGFDYRGDRVALGWLCRVAENRLRDLAQLAAAAKRRPEGQKLGFDRALSLSRESATGPVTAAVRVEAREQLCAALGALDGAEREVLLLRYFEDLTFEQIAARLGRSASGVRRLVARGLERLGRSLDSLDSLDDHGAGVADSLTEPGL